MRLELLPHPNPLPLGEGVFGIVSWHTVQRGTAPPGPRAGQSAFYVDSQDVQLIAGTVKSVWKGQIDGVPRPGAPTAKHRHALAVSRMFHVIPVQGRHILQAPNYVANAMC